MIRTFDVIGKTSVAELCLGIAFLRGAIVPVAAREITGWFDAPVCAGDIDRTITRMMERGWLTPHSSRPDGYILTDAGEDLVEQAFKAFVRFIDAGENRWDVGMMFQIAKTHYDRRRS